MQLPCVLKHCISHLWFFRSAVQSAHTSSVWIWIMLTSMAMQRNWLICPQTCKLLDFNPEAFLTLAYLLPCVSTTISFLGKLVKHLAWHLDTYFWESMSIFLADTNNQDEQMLWVAYCQAGEAVKSFGQMSKKTEITWNSSKTQLLLTRNADFVTEGVTSGLMVSL